ncbi:terminase small subunit [Edwardsiella phage ETP-1]|uniref:Terminase small subunit n=3 Tax=Kafunavirus KF1 TaxID=1982588 RepID=A0A6G5P4M6_9CAUD|nr:terminase small subunit [Edwardsiella phage KF-1]QBP07049.1 terminase small subunit [Edwardsiella phage ETP-1]UIS54103.1 putative terminase small subunit [Edwardsiella phage vB_EpP_ZHX]BAM63049.1 hypothetical protein [Edwardsiella phage KF-1]BAM63097.1 hypothetical protein [Edwardsiella phage IW-1]
MSVRDEVYYKVLSRIDNGEEPKMLAAEFELSESTVLRWKREFEAAKLNGTLSKVYNIDSLVLAKVGEELSAPKAVVENGIVNVTKGLEGLAKLDVDLQRSAALLIQRVNSLIISAERSELETYVSCVCKLRDAFFNSKSTQVNVQNNYSSGQPPYSDFLGDKPNG